MKILTSCKQPLPKPLPACGEGFGERFVENLSIFQNKILTELEF